MVEAKLYPISQGLMELQERSRVYMGTRRSIPEEIPTYVLKDQAIVKCCVLSLEDKAQLTGETITPRVLGHCNALC
ncbi:hypothetical protein Tco_0238677 [Tanacetum coccineum]